jgi:AcrR family transcriptional regulator
MKRRQPTRRSAKEPTARPVAPKSPDVRDADGSRNNILDVATREFSEKGLSGARVDEIAELTNTSKRMIYYYFRSKEGLYKAVLERCYATVRRIDSSPALDKLPPVEALRELVRVTFDFDNSHHDFIRIVMNENIHQGAHIKRMPAIKTRSRAVIAILQRLIDRGVQAGLFRADIDPVELHMSISALCFFNVSNRYTFGIIFHQDMSSAAALLKRREIVVETIERWCCISR